MATAFDGRLERRKVSLGYRLALCAVAFLMLLLPVVYFGIIAGACWTVYVWASNGSWVMHGVRNVYLMLAMGVVYVAPILAGGLLVVAMIVPLFWRSQRGPKVYWVDRREQPLLWAYVEKLCDVMNAPRPYRISITAEPNASASMENGIFGLVRRRLGLTLGLSLAANLSIGQFTAVVAHELAHFSQGSSMRLSYLVRNINGWFGRMAYGRSGVDDFVDSLIDDEPHWTVYLVGLVCQCVLAVARLLLKGMALASHALTMNLARQAEFDADRQSARIVGSEAGGAALEIVPFLDVSFKLALTRAQGLWSSRRLPDNLVAFARAAHHTLAEPAKQKITASILSDESSWFDTHPPLYKRIGALKKAKLQGVLRLQAPATELFRDFDELSKMATIDLYHSTLGEALQPEHLVEVSTPSHPVQ